MLATIDAFKGLWDVNIMGILVIYQQFTNLSVAQLVFLSITRELEEQGRKLHQEEYLDSKVKQGTITKGDPTSPPLRKPSHAL